MCVCVLTEPQEKFTQVQMAVQSLTIVAVTIVMISEEE